MKRQYFGTDGIRGEYGGPILNETFAYRLGRAVGLWIGSGTLPAKVLMGRDTRESGESLTHAIATGLKLVGCEVQDLGVVPTPAVAVCIREMDADLGIVITASHNPAKDNGIKFFNKQGTKLTDLEELRIEEFLEGSGATNTPFEVFVESCSSGRECYEKSIIKSFPNLDLKGMGIVIDSANGATYQTSPECLKKLGAELTCLGNQPDGQNINRGVGSQCPELMCKQVVELGAAIGIAHDGDGDRLVVCDEKGQVIDGDVLLYLLAAAELKAGDLVASTLVATQQSNLGLDRSIEALGGKVLRTDIGDRYVLEALKEGGFNLGGENSGHVIFTDYNPTGDGLLAALKVLSLMLAEKKPLSELAAGMQLFPQKTGAIQVADKPDLEEVRSIQGLLCELKSEMRDEGRVLLRYSGTEPKIRILVEGKSEALVNEWYSKLEVQVKASLC